jgi:cytochrome P450
MSTIVRPPGPGVIRQEQRRVFQASPMDFLSSLQREHGDVVYFRIGLRDQYLLSDPEHIKEILLTHHERFRLPPHMLDAGELVGENLFTIEGDLHRRHRRLIQPAFHWDRVRSYGSIMVEEATRAADAFDEGEPRDITSDMAYLTLGVVTRALFGTDLPDDTKQRITSYVRTLLDGWLGLAQGARRSNLERREYREALEAQGTIVDELIAERRREPGDRVDLLSLLLEAQDEDGTGLSDREIRDEITGFIAAGHESTSNALTWTWYLLSQNPDADATMYAQLDEVLRGRLPSVEDLESIPYVEQVFTESLRVIPVAWGITRMVVEEHEVGGYTIPPGSIVTVSPWVVHHDPRWYPDPDRFDPERWTKELRTSRPRYAYFPFSGGHRMCIGQPFAVLEATLVLATIAQRWRLGLEPGHPVEMEPRVTLRPHHGMRMIPERR